MPIVHIHPPLKLIRFLVTIFLSAVSLISLPQQASAKLDHQPVDLMAQAARNGTVNVIVTLNAPPFRPTTRAEFVAQAPIAAQARAALLNELSSAHLKATVYAGSDWLIPAVALTVDQSTLAALERSPLVQSVGPDGKMQVEDAPSDAQIGASAMWTAVSPNGYTGTGQTIAIIDTGVQENHPFFTTDGTPATSRILTAYEACFSGNGNAHFSFCPGGSVSVTGPGAGAPCPVSGCDHGTHVAGIAAGYGGYSGGIGYSGVAPGASILPIQVFSSDGVNSKVGYFSDIISGLNWVATVYNYDSVPIAAVNLSIGEIGSDYSTTCDNFMSSMTNAINALRGLGIATVISAGDDGLASSVDFPACISSAISVGAVDNKDVLFPGGDSGALTTILAPGVGVASSVTGGAYDVKSGTSAAAPQVAGAIALLRQEDPIYTNPSVTQIVGLLTNTGHLLFNSTNNIYQPRLQIDAAGLVALPRPRTIGIYRNNTFYLRNTNTVGIADQTIPFGSGADAYPVVGDWNARRFDQLGVYNRSNGLFTLCLISAADNSSCAGAPSGKITQFVLGNPNDYPIAGRWNPRGTYTADISGNILLSTYPPDGAGVFRPSNGLIYLKNALTTGYADYTMVLGIPGDHGIAGDWNLDGKGSPGVYRPSNAVFYLSNRVLNGSVYADVNFIYGNSGTTDLPVIGSWLGAGSPSLGIGVYRTNIGYFMLRNTLTTGYADLTFYYGLASDIPVAGDWNYRSSFFKPPSNLKAPPPILQPRATNPANGNASAGNLIGD